HCSDVIGAQTDAGHRSPGRLSDLISSRLCLFRRGGRHDHVVAGLRERLRQMTPDSAGTAGDEGDRLRWDRSRFCCRIAGRQVRSVRQLLGHVRAPRERWGYRWSVVLTVWVRSAAMLGANTTEPGRTTVTVDRAL